jgi:D-alanyl-D-alanine carboxypeptidase/D-alanyl-D-alanine-endopeptidase (penicillin-binding protein 4)
MLPVAAQAADTLTAGTSDTPTATITVVAAPVDLVAQARVLALIQKRAAKVDASTRSGFAAVNADGTPVWKTRANTPLMPASTMKVVTATVALYVLGPTWKPITSVTFDTATGTLTLVGGGDPSLTSARLGQLANAVMETLTSTRVTPTRLKIDDSLFPAPSLQPGFSARQWPSEERPVRALVVDGRRSMDAALDAGRTFDAMLAKRGLSLPFKGRGLSSGDEVAHIQGLRLQSILRDMLWFSDNDYADMMFRLSALGAGRTASWADARLTAEESLHALGVKINGTTLVDGSGLSRDNRLTPFALADLLRIAQVDTHTAMLPTLLPTAGVSGTLRTRFAKAPASCVAGTLSAKTGSLHDVIALAGYAPLDDGSLRPFAILTNHVRNSASARNAMRVQVDNLAAAFSGC